MRMTKVLDQKQVNWREGELTRLNYQMIFDESPEEDVFDEEVDVIEQLNKRDEIWKNKLQVEKEKAYRQGLEDGKEAALKTARKEADAKMGILKAILDQGHLEWKTRQKIMDPGLLYLAFEIAESILGIPVENEEIRVQLEERLLPIFQKLDEQSKPVIKVSNSDMGYVKELKNEYSKDLTVQIINDDSCNPGEFEIETNEEIIVHKFRETLKEFKNNLMLPTWKK